MVYKRQVQPKVIVRAAAALYEGRILYDVGNVGGAFAFSLRF
jgi:hypothetical protein